MADRDIEQAADLAAETEPVYDMGYLSLPAELQAEIEAHAAAEYVRITRRPLDGNAKGPLEWDDILAADLDNPGPLAADQLDELEVTD